MKYFYKLFLSLIVSLMMIVTLPLNARAESENILTLTHVVKDGKLVFEANYTGKEYGVFYTWDVLKGGKYDANNVSNDIGKYYTQSLNSNREAMKVKVNANIHKDNKLVVLASTESSEVRPTDAELFTGKPSEIELNYSDTETRERAIIENAINKLKENNPFIADAKFDWVDPKTSTLKEMDIKLVFRDNSTLNVKFPLTINKKDITISFSDVSNGLKTIPDSKNMKVGLNWGKIKNEIISSLDLKDGYVFKHFSLSGNKIDDSYVFEDSKEISIHTDLIEQYEFTFTTIPDINDSVVLINEENGEVIAQKDGKYFLKNGKYVLKAINGLYKDMTKGFTIENSNKTIEWKLPNVRNVTFKRASDVDLNQSYVVGSTVEIISLNSRFALWEVKGVELTQEQLTSNAISFKMPDNDVEIIEKIRELNGKVPSISITNYEYNKATDDDLKVMVDLGSEELKASDIANAEYGDETLYEDVLSLKDNELIFIKSYMQTFDEGNKVIKITFNDPNHTEISLNINVIDSMPHTITVVNGKADVSKELKGKKVTVETVNQDKKRFVGWESKDGVVFENPNSLKTSFVMVDKDVTVTAKFEDIKNKLTVIKGNKKDVKDVKIDEVINISSTSNNFVRWAIEGYSLKDYKNKNISIKMPNNNVVIKEILAYKLKVNVNEKDAKIEVINSNNAIINGNNLTLESGSYTLKVSKNGFNTYKQNFNILNSDLNIQVNLTKVSQPNSPKKEEKPKVKRTCEDDGKVWDEAKKMCIALNTNKPITKKNNNTASTQTTKETTKKIKNETKKEENNKNNATPSPTVTPEPTVKPEVTPTPITETAKPEISSKKKDNSLIPYFAGGAIGIVTLGTIIFILLRKYIEEE